MHAETGIPVATSAPDGYLDSRLSGLGKVSLKILTCASVGIL